MTKQDIENWIEIESTDVKLNDVALVNDTVLIIDVPNYGFSHMLEKNKYVSADYLARLGAKFYRKPEPFSKVVTLYKGAYGDAVVMIPKSGRYRITEVTGE